MYRFVLFVLILFLAGCAGSQDYLRYVDSNTAIQTAKYQAEAEKYKAIAAIASTGDQTSRVAAVMALSSNGNQSSQAQGIAAPKSGWEVAREMFSVILPPVIQGYGIHANQQVATTQSNNARDVSLSTNQTMLGMSGLIQAPQANQTISGNGVIGAGSYAAPVDSSTHTSTTTTDTTTTTDSSTHPTTTYTNSYNVPATPVVP